MRPASSAISDIEFRLLSRLVLNKGRTVETSQLLNEVWGGREVSVECLKFYVRRLWHKMAGLSTDAASSMTEPAFEKLAL